MIVIEDFPRRGALVSKIVIKSWPELVAMLVIE